MGLNNDGELDMKAGDIRSARERSGLTQADLARLLAVSPVTVNRWEHGSRTPAPQMLDRITKILADARNPKVRGQKRRGPGPVLLVTSDSEGLLTDGTTVRLVDIIDLRVPLNARRKAQLVDLARTAQDANDANVNRILTEALVNALTK